jgi:hypothetical protein
VCRPAHVGTYQAIVFRGRLACSCHCGDLRRGGSEAIRSSLSMAWQCRDAPWTMGCLLRLDVNFEK